MGFSNEIILVSNKNMRVSNESLGVSNENMAISNESLRVSNETSMWVSNSTPIRMISTRTPQRFLDIRTPAVQYTYLFMCNLHVHGVVILYIKATILVVNIFTKSSLESFKTIFFFIFKNSFFAYRHNIVHAKCMYICTLVLITIYI